MRYLGALAPLALGATAYPFIEARRPRLRRYQLEKAPDSPTLIPLRNPDNTDLPSDWQLRILHLSDLHLWSGSEWLCEYVASLSEFDEIDFVALTGDNFSDASGLAMLKRALKPLFKFPGAFVFGSNDYYSGRAKIPWHYFFPDKKPKLRSIPDLPTEEFRSFLTDGGWIDLNNQVATLNTTSPARQGRSAIALSLALSGVNDPHIGRDETVKVPSTWGQSQLRLALTHAPYARVLDQYATWGADLVLAGHTHGGQVCLPGFGALVNNTDLPLSYSGGLHLWKAGTVANPAPRVHKGKIYPLPDLGKIAKDEQIGVTRELEQTWVHISRGLGTSKFTPVRLACPPEASLITVSGYSN